MAQPASVIRATAAAAGPLQHTARLRGTYAIVNQTLIDSSEQDTLDCSGAGSCQGGWWAFDYLISKGSANDADYLYVAKQGA